MNPMNFRESDLERLVEETRPLSSGGKVATYIPELAGGNPEALAVAAMDAGGALVSAGDRDVLFTMHREFTDMRGLSRANLFYMRAFAEAYPSEEMVQQLAGQIPWWHNAVILKSVARISIWTSCSTT